MSSGRRKNRTFNKRIKRLLLCSFRAIKTRQFQFTLGFGPLMGHYFVPVRMTNEPKNGRPRRRRRKGGGAARLKGRSWEARWSENGERRTQGGFATRSDAEAFVEERARKVVLAEGLADLGLTFSAPRPKTAARKIGSLADGWFEVREREGIKTVHEDRWRWDRHIAPYFSSRTPDSLEEKDLHRWVAGLRNPEPASKYADRTPIRPISGPTAQLSLHLLSAFYRWAIREGYATRNPCRGLRRDPGMAKMLRSTHTPDSTVVLQSKADLERLYRAIPTNYVAAVRQPAERKGELGHQAETPWDRRVAEEVRVAESCPDRVPAFGACGDAPGGGSSA